MLTLIHLLFEGDLLLFDLGVEDGFDIAFAFLYQLFLLGGEFFGTLDVIPLNFTPIEHSR